MNYPPMTRLGFRQRTSKQKIQVATKPKRGRCIFNKAFGGIFGGILSLLWQRISCSYALYANNPPPWHLRASSELQVGVGD
jgi:hypothetical protein